MKIKKIIAKASLLVFLILIGFIEKESITNDSLFYALIIVPVIKYIIRPFLVKLLLKKEEETPSKDTKTNQLDFD